MNPVYARVQHQRVREGVALVLLAVAALLFQRAATSHWAQATGADGTRYEISPIGLRQYPPGATSPTTQCRWWPRLGDAALCAIADAGAGLSTLRRAYPLSVVALWTAVLALFLNALRLPRQARGIRLASAAAPSLVGIGALWSLASGAPRALAVLAGLSPTPLYPGFALIASGIALGLAAVAFLVSSVTGRDPTG